LRLILEVMTVKLCAVVLAGLLAVGLSHSLRGQERASVWDGIYTEDQAKRGDQDYQKECAKCHGAQMEGKGRTPPLGGAEFTAYWDGMTVGLLFETMQSAMPADRPGQLSMEENADILAYLLKSNTFPSGGKELAGDVDALRKIRFEAAKPGK
jgi:S-disulfanyl-L-cysteine oxidoreductase SoxD